jgi:hypothetical protein
MYIDQNAYRHPPCPLEPLFRSIYVLNPYFNPKPIGLVTDRNNLRKILWAILGEPIGDFRVDIELAGDTLLFTRWEEITYENVTKGRKFGHSFENEFTTYSNEMTTSTGHYRIIQYTVGILTILARFEVDGYLPDIAAESASVSSVSEEIEDLTASLQSICLSSIQKPVNASPKFESSNIKVLRGGFNIPHNSLLELKTRGQRRSIRTNDVIFQLWFGQIRHLIAGYHKRGSFMRIEQSDFQRNGEFKKFEKENQCALGQMIKVIDQIKKVLVNGKCSKSVLLFVDGRMKLYEREGTWNALPPDLLSKWD